MADDQVMPDSADETAQGGDSLESAQATGPDAAADAKPEGGAKPEGDAVLTKRIADTESRLKDLQRELHQASLEKARMEGEMAAIKGQRETAADESDWLDADDWREKFNATFNDNPAEALVGLVRKQRAEIAQLLKQRDTYLEGKAREYAEEYSDPTRQQVKGVIEEMKAEQPWFAALDRKAQVEVAKMKLTASGNGKTASIKPPSTSPAGTGTRMPPQPKGDERAKRAETLAKQLWPDSDAADVKLYPMGKE